MYKNLDVWNLSINLVKDVYKLTRAFTNEELHGLTSQIRRSAVSIPSNIAEGAARNSKREFAHFLYVALGSSAELETQLIIAKELGYESSNEIFAKLERIKTDAARLDQSSKERETMIPDSDLRFPLHSTLSRFSIYDFRFTVFEP